MRSMGFDVSTRSHSNYNATWFSLASMFNMAQVDDLPGVMDSPSLLSEIRAMTKSIAVADWTPSNRRDTRSFRSPPHPRA